MKAHGRIKQKVNIKLKNLFFILFSPLSKLYEYL